MLRDGGSLTSSISLDKKSKMSEKISLLLKCQRISKYFRGVTALKDVSLKVFRGEIVALLGDNGAGKSTLVKIIAGVYKPSTGKIFFKGKEVSIHSPVDAKNLGIETIYQNLALAEGLDVSRNIFMGREPVKNLWMVDKKKMDIETKKALKILKIELDSVNIPVEELSGGQRQATAITRGIYWEAKFIILDEPTASLGMGETQKILKLVKGLRSKGIGIIFISHNLEDIFAVANRAVVLRKGKVVGKKNIEETTREELASLMLVG